MGYYMRGDYYRGDYYRGDPLLGALVGGLVGKAAGKVGRWVGRKIGGAARRVGAMTPPILRDAGPSAIGGALGYGVGRLPQLGPSGAAGGAAGPLFGGKVKSYRRMNPLNPKALKRALRRAEGFEKFAKRTVNAMYKVVDGRRVKTFKRTRKSS